MENNQLTAAEARAHMAQGPQYRVRDCDKDRFRMVSGRLQRKLPDGWGDTILNFEDMEHLAPFTPYVKESKRELRERAERADANYQTLLDGINIEIRVRQEAEARVKELESDIIAARRHYHDRVVEETHTLQSQVNTLTSERDALAKENDTLRIIVANADVPCVYCGLSRADMGRCESGFPGCARADDVLLGPIPDPPKDPMDAVPSGTYTSPKSAPPVVGLLSCDCGWSGTHDALWTGEVYLCPLCAEEVMEETP